MVDLRISKEEPALIVEGEKKYIVITDLHIGFESEFVSNKIEIGKNSSINETVTVSYTHLTLPTTPYV